MDNVDPYIPLADSLGCFPNCFEGKLYCQLKRMVNKFILVVGCKLARGDECGKRIGPGWGLCRRNSEINRSNSYQIIWVQLHNGNLLTVNHGAVSARQIFNYQLILN